MLIENKLVISCRENYLSLFDEGFFLRMYNQSAYIFNEEFNQNLKLNCNMIKKLNNQPIVYCAFPKSQISYRIKNAVKTEWGYQVEGHFNLSSYLFWFNNIVQSVGLVVNQNVNVIKQQKQVTYSNTTCNYSNNIELNSEQQLDLTSIEITDLLTNLSLTPKQLNFLKNWQPGLYQSTINDRFIESLKRKLIKS